MRIELNEPFEYSKDAETGKTKVCKALQLKKPTFKDIDYIENFINVMSNGKNGEIIRETASVVERCCKIFGDENWPIDENFVGLMTISDLLEIAQNFGNFIFPPENGGK